MKDPLIQKVQCMDDLDKFCALSVDEMMISTQQDYDKNVTQLLWACNFREQLKIKKH